jgi:RNA polymerase sigma-70 factor (ECF subfamily)
MVTRPTEAVGSEFLGSVMPEYRDGLVSYAEKMLGDHGFAGTWCRRRSSGPGGNVDRLLGMDGSVKAWLFTVTRNLFVDWVRKPHSRREVVGGTYNDPFSEVDPIEAVHHAMVVNLALGWLSPEHRAVLEHLGLWDRTIKETAAVLGIPMGAVKSRHYNALRKLRSVPDGDGRLIGAARILDGQDRCRGVGVPPRHHRVAQAAASSTTRNRASPESMRS